jgi:hypothetical protein
MMDSDKKEPCEGAECHHDADASSEAQLAQTRRIPRSRGDKLVQMSKVLEVANIGNRIAAVPQQKLDAIPEHARSHHQSDGEQEQRIAICEKSSHRLTKTR